MQYIALIHRNVDTQVSGGEWNPFLKRAEDSGLFRGGSAIGGRHVIGDPEIPDTAKHVGGYMRFDADELNDALDLLRHHPVVVHGGSIELCELPKT
jgi:hypothetical protein